METVLKKAIIDGEEPGWVGKTYLTYTDSPIVPNQSASKRICLLFGGASGFQIAIYLKYTFFSIEK